MKSLVGRNCRAALLLAAIAILTLLSVQGHTQTAAPSKDTIWTVPEVGALPDDSYGRLVRRGRDLITATYAHIGPDVSDPSRRFAGNNLACGNCHLEAGTKRFGLPIFGLYDAFPRYSARAGAEITIEERVNSCMARSMNGRAIPNDAPEMAAFVAYIKFLSSGVPPDQRIPGLGAGNIPELDRAADPKRGRTIYVAKCAGCHNTDGSGIRRSLPTTDLGYLVPPLWGPDSFNDGAGMDRLITAANFVHSNMPQGADYLNPVLSKVDAWDVAAFIVSQPRPQKAGLEKDFPDLAQKPVDTPYGPYRDGFSETQHKYGPFAPIRAALARLRQKDPPRRRPKPRALARGKRVLIDFHRCANICAFEATAVAKPDTNRNTVVARLKREGWIERHGGSHDVFKRPTKPGRIVVPRHRTLSPGVARAIAQQAGWH